MTEQEQTNDKEANHGRHRCLLCRGCGVMALLDERGRLVRRSWCILCCGTGWLTVGSA